MAAVSLYELLMRESYPVFFDQPAHAEPTDESMLQTPSLLFTRAIPWQFDWPHSSSPTTR